MLETIKLSYIHTIEQYISNLSTWMNVTMRNNVESTEKYSMIHKTYKMIGKT